MMMSRKTSISNQSTTIKEQCNLNRTTAMLNLSVWDQLHLRIMPRLIHDLKTVFHLEVHGDLINQELGVGTSISPRGLVHVIDPTSILSNFNSLLFLGGACLVFFFACWHITRFIIFYFLSLFFIFWFLPIFYIQDKSLRRSFPCDRSMVFFGL